MRGSVLSRLAPHADVIISSYAANASFVELAEHFNCSWQTIRRFLLANGVPLRREVRGRKLDKVAAQVFAAFLTGVSTKQIADQHGVAVETVRSFIVEKLPAVLADGSLTSFF